MISVSVVRERGLAGTMQQNRVELSILACDLRGFTAFAETAAPEDVIQFLRAERPRHRHTASRRVTPSLPASRGLTPPATAWDIGCAAAGTKPPANPRIDGV
jgi:hypothetical protein